MTTTAIKPKGIILPPARLSAFAEGRANDWCWALSIQPYNPEGVK